MHAQNTNAARKGRAHFYHHFDNDTRHKKNARKFVKKLADDSHFGNSFREQSVRSGRPPAALDFDFVLEAGWSRSWFLLMKSRHPQSRKAAKECSRQRKLWGNENKLSISPAGAKEKVADRHTCHDPN